MAPPAGLTEAGFCTFALLLVMALFWFTEVLPITATGFLPVLVLPLVGAGDMGKVANAYMSDVIFLVLGASLIALAVQKWGFHQRIATIVIRAAGDGPSRLVLAFMVATAAIALWMSITATALIMVPVTVSVLNAVLSHSTAADKDKAAFSHALLLGVCYAAVIGGMATLVGSPTNAIAVGILRKELGLDITFLKWLCFSLPLLALSLPLLWLLLTHVVFRFTLEGFSGQAVLAAVGRPGPLTRPELRLLPILALTLVGWLGGSFIRDVLPGFKDASAALIGAMLLFVVPARQGEMLLTWTDAREAPWDILMLFGGGLALADAIVRTGLSDWMGLQLASLAGVPIPVLVVALVFVVMVVTEFASNVATAAGFIPVVIGLVGATGLDGVLLGMTVALASSWGFMMPCATPANTIVLSTGYVNARTMMRTGFLVDLLGFIVIPLAVLIGRALV